MRRRVTEVTVHDLLSSRLSDPSHLTFLVGPSAHIQESTGVCLVQQQWHLSASCVETLWALRGLNHQPNGLEASA